MLGTERSFGPITPRVRSDLVAKPDVRPNSPAEVPRPSAYSPRDGGYVAPGTATPRKITFVPAQRKVAVVSLGARPCHNTGGHARSESGIVGSRLDCSYALRPGPPRHVRVVPGEAKTAPCTPNPLYRSVRRGSPPPPQLPSAALSATAPSAGKAAGEPSRSRLRPLVLPAWPSTVAWTTFQPGTSPCTVERQISTASVSSEMGRPATASSTPRVVSLRSWPRTLSYTTSFRSPSPSPRLYSAPVRPLPSSGSFQVVRATSPPVVQIDLTQEHRQASEAARRVSGSNRQAVQHPPVADIQASTGYRPGRELQREDPPEATDGAKTDEETTDDESQELNEEDWSARSRERARYREDGFLPTAERLELCGRMPKTVLL
ncbi:unnamed protein product [Symbiodinium natans]|uniref:Uncharacterized protein n=1 Tax=Symbiodinium natans TaxID=878477 RepID=A0A812S2B0_9DINO|nr:unnamed protein product [Symbiodinium natans]